MNNNQRKAIISFKKVIAENQNILIDSANGVVEAVNEVHTKFNEIKKLISASSNTVSQGIFIKLPTKKERSFYTLGVLVAYQNLVSYFDGLAKNLYVDNNNSPYNVRFIKYFGNYVASEFLRDTNMWAKQHISIFLINSIMPEIYKMAEYLNILGKKYPVKNNNNNNNIQIRTAQWETYKKQHTTTFFSDKESLDGIVAAHLSVLKIIVNYTKNITELLNNTTNSDSSSSSSSSSSDDSTANYPFSGSLNISKKNTSFTDSSRFTEPSFTSTSQGSSSSSKDSSESSRFTAPSFTSSSQGSSKLSDNSFNSLVQIPTTPPTKMPKSPGLSPINTPTKSQRTSRSSFRKRRKHSDFFGSNYGFDGKRISNNLNNLHISGCSSDEEQYLPF